ncbi:MAG: hypothetical protein NUV67_01990 [archaeon]|nr:hypothetical protein [archaeon]
MGEDIPRRLRRFHRDSDSEIRERGEEIAIEHVDKFREQNNRYPASKELDEISDNVFNQLKKELQKSERAKQEISQSMEFIKNEGKPPQEKTGAEKSPKEKMRQRRQKRQRQEKKAAKKGNEKAKEDAIESGDSEELETKESYDADAGNVGELLGEDDSQEAALQAKGTELRELVGMDEVSQLESGLDDEGDFDVLEKEVDSGNSACPNCNNKAKEIIYCPKCGTAFCDHCAKKVEVQDAFLKYSCPKCGEEFKKKRHS